jgi:hypothetical protein
VLVKVCHERRRKFQNFKSDHEGDFKDAALEGERVLTLPVFGTSDAQIHFLLANLYLKLKQPDLAKAHLEKFQAAPQTTRR